MQYKQPISIIVPTLNEAENIPRLLARIDATLTPKAIPYEVVVVDDHSSDGTIEVTRNLTSKYPVRLSIKKGKRGKAYSLLQGFTEANNDLIVMIDADLQYAPEEIAPMYELMAATNADVVVTKRQEKNVSAIRKLSTKVFNLIFAKLLFGIDFDTQSGLKLFKKRILYSFSMTPSPWSFDLEFLVRALENKYTIVSHDIEFAERTSGDTKVRLFNTTIELIKASLQLRWRTSAPRIRAGYQANNRFLEKAMQVAVVTAAFVSLFSFTTPRAEALSVSTKPVTNTTASVLSDVMNSISGSSSTPNNSGSPASSGASSAPTSNGVVPITTTTPVTPSTAATSPTSNTTTTTTTAANTTTASNAAPAGNGQTTTAAPASIDRSDLSAATGTDKIGLYADSYPNYTLSRKTNDALFNVGQAALTAGILCLITAIIISGIRFNRRHTASTVTVRS